MDVRDRVSLHLQDLLAGRAPDGHRPDEFAEWYPVVEALHTAHQAGGTPSVKLVWGTLVRDQPELAGLVAGATRARRTRWTAAELLVAKFPPVRWAVPQLITEGLTFLAGRPKLGKSWLALQVAHAVATGGLVFGQRVEHGTVLYLALEDSPRRLQDRMRLQRWPETPLAVFATEWDSFDAGGLVTLQADIERNEYRLVIIDTLSRSVGARDQNDVVQMTLVLGSLQQIAHVTNTAILIVDHHRKSAFGESDPIDDILGSTGKGAVADGVIGLYRERGKAEATLKVVGRDIEDRALALEWDAQICCWQSLGDAETVAQDTVQGAIVDAFKALGGKATLTEVTDCVGKDKSNLRKEIQELVAKGVLRRGKKEGRQVPYELVGYDDAE